MSWWLMLLAAVLGFVLSWLWMVRRVTREVPRQSAVRRDDSAAVATGAAAAGAVGLAGAGAATLGRDPEATTVFDQEVPNWGRDAATIGATAAVEKTVEVPEAAPVDPDVMHPVEIEGESDDLPEVESVAAAPAEAATVQSEAVEPELVEPEQVQPESVESEQVETDSGPAGWQYAADSPDTASETDPTAYDAEDSDYVLTEAATDEVTVDDVTPEPDGVGTAGALAGGAVAGGAVAAGATAWSVEGDTLPLGEPEEIEAERLEADEVSPVATDGSHAEAPEDAELTGPETTELTAPEATDLTSPEATDEFVDEDSDEGSVEPIGVDAPYGPGSAAAHADGSGPAGWNVKGNADSMLFHTQESPGFGRTRAEVWFQDEASATSAGFQHWDRKRRGGLTGTVAAVSGGSSPGDPTAAEETGGTARGFADVGVEGEATEGAPDAPDGPGSASAGADGSGPAGWTVKGNANSMLFHTQESPSYGKTRAEVWFQDEESAKAAGFAHWDRKRR